MRYLHLATALIMIASFMEIDFRRQWRTTACDGGVSLGTLPLFSLLADDGDSPLKRLLLEGLMIGISGRLKARHFSLPDKRILDEYGVVASSKLADLSSSGVRGSSNDDTRVRLTFVSVRLRHRRITGRKLLGDDLMSPLMIELK